MISASPSLERAPVADGFSPGGVQKGRGVASRLSALYILYARARPLPRRKDFTDTTDTQIKRRNRWKG